MKRRTKVQTPRVYYRYDSHGDLVEIEMPTCLIPASLFDDRPRRPAVPADSAAGSRSPR